MASEQTIADEHELARLVGSATVARAREYVRDGRVVKAKWDPAAARAFGEVQGTRPQPYTAVARVTRTADGNLASFTGSCTCPMHADCKHSVALLIAALTQPVPPPVVPRLPAWERAVAGLLGDGAATHRPVHAPEFALQFDVVAPLPSRGKYQPATGSRLALRPVTLSHTGNWVRAGISWSNVQYGLPGATDAQRHVLTEVLALHDAGRHSYYPASDRLVHLEAIESRLIWDVLASAPAAGLPLVQAGKRAGPVVLWTEPTEISLDLARVDDELRLSARVDATTERPLPEACLLIGQPAHGIAWWAAEVQHPNEPIALRLGPLTETLPTELHGLLDGDPIRVPGPDEDRFLREFYPRLRRRIRLVSSDESIQLPQPVPPVLELDIRQVDAERIDLEWHWRYGSERLTLWPEPGEPPVREPGLEAPCYERVANIVGGLSPVFDEVMPPRLRSSAALDGIDAVRLTSELLPKLQQSDGLAVTVHGPVMAYHEAADAPVIDIVGQPDADDRDWFNLAVRVSVDGEEVAFDKLFTALAAGHEFLILPSGTYFALNRPEFAELGRLIAEARGLQDAHGAQLKVSRFQASLWDDLERIAVLTAQASDWTRSVRALAQVQNLPTRPQPAALQATLRPYQLDGFNWLTFLYENSLGGVLADEMGLGKTLQTLALISHLREQGIATEPFLVVAPTSVVPNWAAECVRFLPGLAVATVTETQKRRGAELKEVVEGADVVITSYTLLRLEADDYAAIGWAGLIMDEAQFAKNHASQNYRCLKTLPIGFKLAITGTPMENNLLELWSLLSIVAPGLFPVQQQFEQYYRVPIEKERNSDRLAQLRRRIKPLLLRRTKDAVATDLPDKLEQVLELELNPRHRRHYQTYLQRERQKVLRLLDDLDGNRFEIFRSLTLLRQASLDVGLIDEKHASVPSTKLDALLELLTDIASEGHRTLVFSQFTGFLGVARRRLDEAGIDYCYLDGKTKDRAAVLAEFKQGSAPVFLISLKAGGFGLNLTEADYCVLLDPWWNPATEAQAVDRTHRIGQTKKVMVYRLVAKDTIEEKVMALKETKAALFASVLADGEFSSAALSADDIRGLLD